MKVIGVLSMVAGASVFLAPRSPNKAPYHVLEGFKLAIDEYVVVLDDNHTVDDHLTNTGLNLTERAISFNPFSVIKIYHLLVRGEDSDFIHKIIRYDLGVAYVHRNYYKEEIPEMSNEVVKRDFIPDGPSMGKRWNKKTRKRWTQRTSESSGDPRKCERRDFGTGLEGAHEAISKYHLGSDDLPEQQAEPHPDSDRWMIDGDMSDHNPPGPGSSACFELQTSRYVNRGIIVDNIEHFCSAAQARARPDPCLKFISIVYNGGTVNEAILIIDYESPDIDYEVG
ncbi:hypothetical protein N0V84_003599 [Fusarium piperis]|uniref:Uncharacterized protein n=1 Tax=Fusarium piperis TaxID=1435070 RepID=A0A9W8WH75_9HYPO|nr:hypothetical protein N0V84_003599 [Fusarium piperis]